IPDYIIKNADHVAVDSYAAFDECKEMSFARSIGYTKDNIMDAKKLVLNGEKESIKNGVTIFKSVGVSILDVLASRLVYEKLNVKYTTGLHMQRWFIYYKYFMHHHFHCLYQPLIMQKKI